MLFAYRAPACAPPPRASTSTRAASSSSAPSPGALTVTAAPRRGIATRRAPTSSVRVKAHERDMSRCLPGVGVARAGRRATTTTPRATIADEVAKTTATYLPGIMRTATDLSVGQVLAYSAVFAMSLMFAVGALRPALVVMHEGWERARGTSSKTAFPDSFFGFTYKLLRTALFNVGLVFVYAVIVPIASPDMHALFPPERCVRMLKILYAGNVVTSVRKKYLATAAGALRRKMYGAVEPADLIPAHVYDRESAALIWGITTLAALDSLGLPLKLLLQVLGASSVVLGILASVVLRDTIANYFGGLIVIAAGWFVPKEVIRVLIGGRREISGRVVNIGYLYTKLINRAGKVAYIPNSAMVAYKVENLSRAPYREFREQFAISFSDLPKVPDLSAQVEAFLRQTVGADVVRGVSLAPRCTLTGMNSFAGGAVLEIVCYNDYMTFRAQGFTTMRLRHHIFLGLSRIFNKNGVKFAVAGSLPMNGDSMSDAVDTSKPLGGWEASSAKAGRGDELIDPLDDRTAAGVLSTTPWL